MAVRKLESSATSILNHCTKHLAREQGAVSESWRFPLIAPYPEAAANGEVLNSVTFVYDARRAPAASVGVLGTFATLYESVPLEPVTWQAEATGYFALSLLVPEGEMHTYRFVVDGAVVLDPINPQRAVLDDGVEWSRFFTDNCRQPLCFERWQFALLERLVSHILPFRTKAGQDFLNRYYFGAGRPERDLDLARAYRLDDQVGSVNYIDNVLAREESHRLPDYKVCLSIIDRVLRLRNPFIEPARMPRDMFVELYEQMAEDDVPGWDYPRYASPRFFLQLLRRHAYTGAFCHPRYGGNAGGAGWAFLAERYTDAQGKTLFDWRQALEAPLGNNPQYRG
jgi:hypothetical protein